MIPSHPSSIERERDNEDEEEEDNLDKDRSYNDKTGGKCLDPQRTMFGSAGKSGGQSFK
jgi:hypothetical protein